MHRRLFGIGPRVHHGHDHDLGLGQNKKGYNTNLSLDPVLKRHMAVPPSRNTHIKFLHAINNTSHNNKRPAVSADGTGLSGCWLIFKHVDELDEAWEKVKKATEAGELGYRSNVRTIKDDESYTKVISVCTYNAFDVNDVLRVRQALQNLGFTAENEDEKLQYKTLADTDEEICYEDHEGAYVSVHRDYKLK